MKIANRKFCLIFASVAALLPCWTHHGWAIEYKVYLLGGQSNGDGRAYNTGLPSGLQAEQTDVRIYYDDMFDSTANNPAWQNLRPGLSGGYGQGRGGTTQFGPEITFGQTMADAMPSEHVAVIKYTYGGTDLENDWKSSEPKGAHYQNFLDTVNDALDDLATAGHTHAISGMLWMQGEKDANDEECSNHYQTNLTNFIASVRNELSVPDMRFVIGQITNRTVPPRVYGSVVKQAQYNVSQNVSNAPLVVTDDLGLQGDNIHYNASGQLALGERFANRFLEIPGPGVPLNDNFDRPDNDDVSAGLAPVSYYEKDAAAILNNRLRLGYPSVGGDTTWVVPDHDFVDSAITDAGGFVFEFDVDPVVGGGGTSNDWAAVSVGHSLTSATGTNSPRFRRDDSAFSFFLRDNTKANLYIGSDDHPAGGGWYGDEITVVDVGGDEVYHVKITVATTSFATGQSGEVTINVDGTDYYSSVPIEWYSGCNYINMESYGCLGSVSDYDNLEIYTLGGTEPIPGDANLDNVVNDQDASILAANWQQTGAEIGWGDGDFDGNNIVNDADASILAAHWQESQEGTAAVPEPSTIVLLAFAAVSLLVWRRRK